MILKSAGAELGLTHPSQMFWVTGALSSFLDNTPTYLVFLTTAGSMGFVSGLTTALELDSADKPDLSEVPTDTLLEEIRRRVVDKA